MTQRHEFPVEHGTGPKASDEGRHAAVPRGVPAWLGTVGLGHVLNGARGRARQVAFLRDASISLEGVAKIGFSGLRRELNGYRDRMTVDDRHPVAMSADLRGEGFDAI